jgi:hypothetical protein
MATEMDVLVMENFLLIKQQQASAGLEITEEYKAQYALD